MLGNTSVTSLAVFTSQWLANHTWNTKVLIVEFPQAQEFVNHSFLRAKTTKFWNKARLVNHGTEVEIST